MTDIAELDSKQMLDVAAAAASNVAVFDLSDRTQIEVTGADRATFLQGFTSNDVKRLRPGQGCETFITSLKGKVIAHLFVFCGENSLWLDGTPGQQQAVLTHLGKYILIDDVQLVPRDQERGELYVTGPFAAQLLQLEDSLAVCQQVTRDSGDASFDIRRVDLLGQPGFLLSIPTPRITTVKQSLCGLGVKEGPRELFDALRIAAGFPRYGVDITDDYLAQEVARTKQSVSFTKGCYLGQETVARLDALGHTNQELVRIRFTTDLVPDRETVVYSDDLAAEVGTITSAAPDLVQRATNGTRSVVAIGRLKRVALKSNSKVAIQLNGIKVEGVVQ